MTKYDFFVAQLRFVEKRTECESDDISCMMGALGAISDELSGGKETFFVPAKSLRISSRALAGVAGFLQQHILPEAILAGNASGEKQIRWTVETCMMLMAKLLTHAELTHDAEGLRVTLPPLD